jgi:hypothetical protein
MLNNPTNQNLYMEITFDDNKRSISPNKSNNRLTFENAPDEKIPFDSKDSKNDIESVKNEIEELKKKIHDYEAQKEKYNHQLDNIKTNTNMLYNKSRGKFFFILFKNIHSTFKRTYFWSRKEG